MTTVRLNAFGLVTDGNEMSTIASDVTAAWTSLSSSLSGSAGMAGDDELAEDWSPDYDDSAKGCARGTEAVASFLQSFDGLLAGTGAAYKEAELTGAGKPGTSGIEIPAGTTSSAAVPPSALGANPLPGGLGELAELVEGALYAVGVVFPRGDTDALRAASGAWSSFAGDIATAQSRLGSTLVELAAADVPQSGVANDVRTAISGMLGDIGDAADGNSASLAELADNIDATWAEIRSMLEALAIELAIDIGISVALSFVTFGVGALAGAAKATTTIARWVVKIADLIRKLKIINRIPADKFLRASSVLRKLEHGPLRWRFGTEVVKGTISGAASSVIVSARSGEEITVESLLTTLAGGVVGGVAGGGAGAGFAAVFGRNAGRHAVQPTFFRASATEAAKGAAEGAAGGVAGGATESALSGQEFNPGLAALFGMGAGSAMGAGGHSVGAAIDAHGGTGLGFDADAALSGGDGENVSPAYLAERRTASDGAVGRSDGASSAPSGTPTHGAAPVPTNQGGPAPSPVSGTSAGGSTVGAGAAVSTSVDAPAATAGAGGGTSSAGGGGPVRTDVADAPTVGPGAGGGTSTAGGAGPVRTDVTDVDTTPVSEPAPSGDGASHASSPESTVPDPTTGSDSGTPGSSAPETTADSSVADSSSTSETSGTTESSAPESSTSETASSDSSRSDSSSSDASTTSEPSSTPETSPTPEPSVTPDSTVTPESTTPASATPEAAVTETPAGAATTSETVPSDADAATASSIGPDLVTADQLGVSQESGGDASAIPSDAQLADVQSAIDADVAAHAEAAAAHASPQGDTVGSTPETTATPQAAASTTSATPESTPDATPVDVASSARDDATLGEHATPADTASEASSVRESDAEASTSTDEFGDAEATAVAAVGGGGSLSAAGAVATLARPTIAPTTGRGGDSSFFSSPTSGGGNVAGDAPGGGGAGGSRGGDGGRVDGPAAGDHAADPVSDPTGNGGLPAETHTEASVADEAAAYRAALAERLASHGLDDASFRDLASKNILDLSRSEIDTLLDIRDSIADVVPGDVLQKVIGGSELLAALGRSDFDRIVGTAFDRVGQIDDQAGQPTVLSDAGAVMPGFRASMSGFFSKLAHVTGWSNGDVRNGLGLNYEGSEFRAGSGQAIFAVRMEADAQSAALAYSENEPLRFVGDVSNDPRWEGASRTERELMVESALDNEIAADPESEAELRDLRSRVRDALAMAPSGAHEAVSMRPGVAATNPYRGSGLGGVDGHATPENSFRHWRVGGVPSLRRGAELWQYPADGGPQRRIAVFDGSAWQVLV